MTFPVLSIPGPRPPESQLSVLWKQQIKCIFMVPSKACQSTVKHVRFIQCTLENRWQEFQAFHLILSFSLLFILNSSWVRPEELCFILTSSFGEVAKQIEAVVSIKDVVFSFVYL